MNLAVDLGRVAFAPPYAAARPGLIDDHGKMLADFSFQLASANFLAVFHKAPVADLLNFGCNKGKPEIIGRSALDRLIFEGANAVDFCLIEPIEKQPKILLGLAGK